MSKRKFLAAIVALLIATLACELPGLSSPPDANPPASNSFSTIVAGTANAAATQTALVALSTPSPTLDPNAPTTTLDKQEDGTFIFTDHQGGYAIVVPSSWLAARPNSDEFNSALTKAKSSNTMLHDQMAADQAGYEPNYDRLYSYVLRPDIKKNVIFGFSKLVWDSEDTASIDSTTMGELVRTLESSGDILGFRVDNAQVHENGNTVSMIEIGGRHTISDGQGGFIPFYSTIIFFKPTPNSTARITFTYLQDYKRQISTDVKAIIESVKLLSE